MIYLGCYLFIGLLLVIIKSPIRKLVDSEIMKTELNSAINDEEVPAVKMVLFRITLSGALMIIYPLMLLSEFKERRATKKELVNYEISPTSNKSWLQNEISKEEAEVGHIVEIDGRKVPFGYTNYVWCKLLEKIQDGDRLYEFKSSDDSWQHLAGRQGIALVRDGEIVADIVTRMN